MIIPYTITQTSPGLWRVAWFGEASVDVWLYGKRVSTANTTGYISILWDGCPPVEIVPHDTEPESLLASPSVSVQWFGTPQAGNYLIQRRTGTGAWVTLASLPEDGRGHYTWKSPIEDDGLTVQFRVVTVSGGVTAASAGQAWYIIRHPEAPSVDVTMAYVDGEESSDPPIPVYRFTQATNPEENPEI